jgi:hypothetical protein
VGRAAAGAQPPAEPLQPATLIGSATASGTCTGELVGWKVGWMVGLLVTGCSDGARWCGWMGGFV